MEQLSSCGSFSIGGQRLTGLQKVFWAGYADDKMTADEIRLVYERTHYVMDPHTAVGSCVLRPFPIRCAVWPACRSAILPCAIPMAWKKRCLPLIPPEN